MVSNDSEHDRPFHIMPQTLWSNLASWLVLSCDAPEPWRLGLQDPASPVAEGLTELHDTIMFYVLLIGVGVGWVMVSLSFAFSQTRAPISHRYYNHGTVVELVWTVSPALVLIAIALPSFKLLYLMDRCRSLVYRPL